MSRLTDLLRQVHGKDKQLAEDLRREFEQLSRRRAFGLNFERHVPETVELPGRPVRKGDKVRFLAERGKPVTSVDRRLWQVVRVRRDGKQQKADLVRQESAEAEIEEVSRAVDDLVVVAEFRDPIFPGLKSTGRVERGGDKPFHTVINAENYHALQALLYTHEGKVDAIYIDPPYNSGARDWKYNNDYVDSDDAYRHSKWLAMIERRLKVAKRLLNPADSVLIVTIDEREYLRLGLLLEQTFPEARIQMVSNIINPKGATRSAAFGRTDEYLFFVMSGDSAPAPVPLSTEWKVTKDRRAGRIRWAELIRSGSNTRREDSPNQFYPVFIKNGERGPEFHSVGNACLDEGWKEIDAPDGCVAVWPIRSDGSEGNWQISAPNLRTLIQHGYAKLGRWRGESTAITYLKRGEQKKVENGVFPIIDRRQDNSIVVDDTGYKPVFIPGTQWRIASHNAEQGGTNLLKQMVPSRRFPFPKSLYAVEDSIRFFVANKPGAVILDFFSGSGTTAHAVMRLNKQDNARRQCISVTNNEVSADEQKRLRKKGLRPGDADWEALGICEYIAKPRIKAAITGQTPEGEPIRGDYKFTDEFPMADGFEENVEFFDLTYHAPRPLAHHREFEAIAPLLWLKAGAEGRRIDKSCDDFDVAGTYGVLFDLDAVQDFVDAVKQADSMHMAFIITDDDRGFQSVCAELPARVAAVRLYESYLRNFVINAGRE